MASNIVPEAPQNTEAGPSNPPLHFADFFAPTSDNHLVVINDGIEYI